MKKGPLQGARIALFTTFGLRREICLSAFASAERYPTFPSKFDQSAVGCQSFDLIQLTVLQVNRALNFGDRLFPVNDTSRLLLKFSQWCKWPTRNMLSAG